VSIPLKCKCGNPLTEWKRQGEEIVVTQCDMCTLVAYALGYADKTASSAEKLTAADIVAAWGVRII
jgi:hypothetical protein